MEKRNSSSNFLEYESLATKNSVGSHSASSSALLVTSYFGLRNVVRACHVTSKLQMFGNGCVLVFHLFVRV